MDINKITNPKHLNTNLLDKNNIQKTKKITTTKEKQIIYPKQQKHFIYQKEDVEINNTQSQLKDWPKEHLLSSNIHKQFIENDKAIKGTTVDRLADFVSVLIGEKVTSYFTNPLNEEIKLKKINSILDLKNLKKPKTKTNEMNSYYLNNLKNNLSLEINRSLRSKLAFSLIHFYFEDIDKENKQKLKKAYTKRLRNIDQIYTLTRKDFIFILPLTGESGAQLVINSLYNISKKIISTNLNILNITFPNNHFFNKEVDYTKLNYYCDTIMSFLLTYFNK